MNVRQHLTGNVLGTPTMYVHHKLTENRLRHEGGTTMEQQQTDDGEGKQ
jgi:hypothetical protein